MWIKSVSFFPVPAAGGNPPFHTFSGPAADTGCSDLACIFFTDRLAQDGHRKVKTAPSRLMEHDPCVPSYAACAKTGFGKRGIGRINEELRAARGTAAHRRLFEVQAGDLGERSRKECADLYTGSRKWSDAGSSLTQTGMRYTP